MTVDELFDKHANNWELKNGNKTALLDRLDFTFALAEAIEGGHLQPVVMPGREEVEGKGWRRIEDELPKIIIEKDDGDLGMSEIKRVA